ncbi:MAG: hypothetical protein KAS11_02265 [Candidatus Aenigmarchaeota archaeon]|nr:hypothetical protein [Candidatus Aenigmarchaeota archaeon]
MGNKKEEKSDGVIDNLSFNYYELGRIEFFEMEYCAFNSPKLLRYRHKHMNVEQEKQCFLGIADSATASGLLDVAYLYYLFAGVSENPEYVQKLIVAAANKKEVLYNELGFETDESPEDLLNSAIFREYIVEEILTAPDEFKKIYVSETEKKVQRMYQEVNERIAKGPEYFYDVDSLIRKFESMRWSRKNIDTRYCMIKKTLAIADAYVKIGKEDEADRLYDLIEPRYKDMSFSDLLERYNKP